MESWHHSGLEGLCTALAGPNASKAGIARELFNGAGRFDKDYSVARTWTLSRSRRIGAFEEAWLGKKLSSKRRSGLSAKKALSTCMDTLFDTKRDTLVPTALADAGDPAYAAGYLHDEVLAALADGFSTERYPRSAIVAFKADMDALAAGWDGKDARMLRAIARRLVAAAIYGPAHPEALSPETAKTFEEKTDAPDTAFREMETGEVVVTHLYDGIAAAIGETARYDGDAVVLIGRSSHVERYRARVAELGIASVLDALESRHVELMRLPELHKRVSACHGALVCEQGTWYYYDLASTNGTLVGGQDSPFRVEDLCTVQPGDVLYLGVRDAAADDGLLFFSGAALLVSMRVDPGAVRVEANA